MSIVISILVFSIIVIFHEWGHFLFARRAGIMVEEFALGMGPKLFGKKYGDTLYSVRAIPFGGFCRMLGEDDPEVVDERSFGAQSVWDRFLVVFGGPLFNFIMAFVFAIIFIALTGISTTKVAEVVEGMPAYEAGIRAGDKIVSYDDMAVIKNKELQTYLNVEKEELVTIGVERDGQKMSFEVSPVEKDGVVVIGIVFDGISNAGVLDIIKHSFIELAFMIRLVFYSLGKLLSGGVSVKQMMGPVGLVSTMSSGYTSAATFGVKNVIAFLSYFVVLLSANLGVMNLLPIPALDGGRLVFIIFEGITGKTVKPEWEGKIHFVGFALLMILMVFIMYNDIARLFTGALG